VQPGSEAQPPSYVTLTPGDPFPWIRQRSGAEVVRVDSTAGRYLVLCFFGSANNPVGRAAIDTMLKHRALFDDQRACFFGVSADPSDEAQGRVCNDLPGVRFLWDFDFSASKRCGAMPSGPTAPDGSTPYNQFWLVVDPTLHVLAKFPFGAAANDQVFAYLQSLPPPDRFAGFEIPAPVLVLPNVFEQNLCHHLVAQHEQHGGKESGYVVKDREVQDHSFKRRKDFIIEDEQLKKHINTIIGRRILPEIEKLFFMKITRMDRFLVACYDADDGGHFGPHRDNTSALTAYRRFAVSINLNRNFDGGEVSFPEYNRRGLKALPGWAVVFPCAILHMVSKVTRGRRYTFLPFVFDESGAILFDQARQARADAPQRATT